MRKKGLVLVFILFFGLLLFISIQPVEISASFSDVDFDTPHHDYTEIPPVFTVNSSPKQDWKKTDIDFIGSVHDEDEMALELGVNFGLDGALPGKLAAVEGYVDFGVKIGMKYDVTFGYDFGVDHYSWANDMAVSEGQNFSYLSYVDGDKLELWADIHIEPYLKFWAKADAYLELGGHELVDWDIDWTKDYVLPIDLTPNLDLMDLLEVGQKTPIGDLISTPEIGLGIEIPNRLEFSIFDYLLIFFDFGVGAHIQFQIRGLIECLTEIGGDSGAYIEGGKSSTQMKYYDEGKNNIESITIHVPAGSADKILEILSHDFKYSIEPGVLLSFDGHVDAGFKLNIPTPVAYIKQARTICDWLPWGEKVYRTVFEWVIDAATIVDDINIDEEFHWSAEKEYWIPFTNIDLLRSSSTVLETFKVLRAKEHRLTVDQNWVKSWNRVWSVDVGPGRINLSAYAGYSFNLLLKGILYTLYKHNDQIAGHPFNYYVGVDGDHSEDGILGGSVAAGYSLDLEIPYLGEWINLKSYDFNSSDLSGLDFPLDLAEISCGVSAINLAAEAKFHDLNSLKIKQSANGFIGEWETTPFFTVGMSLDCMLFQVISMNLGSVDVDFLIKGVGDLTGDISASGAGQFDTNQMQWDAAGDINYANIYPKANAKKGDIIDILIQNLKYNLNLTFTIRVTARLYAYNGYLEYSYDFDIPITDTPLQIDVNEDIHEEIRVSSSFNPIKITYIPEEVTAGVPFNISWETANSSTGQTRLKFGNNPFPITAATYNTNPKVISSPNMEGHNETIILNKTGTWYFVAHLDSTNPSFQYYSKVYSLVVKPRVNITSYSENVTAGETIQIQWNIFGPYTVESTNIWISNTPIPTHDPAQETQVQFGAAGNFNTNIKFDKIGTYYLVAHAKTDNKGEDHFSQVVKIVVSPNITITVLPSPNNASFEFMVNWSIKGADYIARTFLQYSQDQNFDSGVYSTLSQSGYIEDFSETLAIFVKGTWYIRVFASMQGVDDVYYSPEPFNTTDIDPYAQINPGYPENVTVNESFKLYWWVFGFNSSVNSTKIVYSTNTDVFNHPNGSTIVHSGNTTDFSDTFSISEAGMYYFQANFTCDNETKSWNSSKITILVLPKINVTSYPPNATAFTDFQINYTIDGLNVNTTSVDLWYGEIENISAMVPLKQSVTGGNILARINVTGLYYFAINLTYLGTEIWTDIFSIQIVPYIEIQIPWLDIDPLTDVNPDMTPQQFAISGIPVTITWIVSNVSTVNHTDIHFVGKPNLIPVLAAQGGPYFKYDFTAYKAVSGWMTPEQNGTGANFYIFSVNVTFNVQEFTWVYFKAHVVCDNKTFNYYSNSSGIPVYPAAEAIQFNYSVVVNKTDIGINPKNFSITWAMNYITHPYVDGVNTPNAPGYFAKIQNVKYARIYYMLNYDPYTAIYKLGIVPNATAVKTYFLMPGTFTDEIEISSIGTYYFRILIMYNYTSTDENFTYPQYINQTYWSPLYKIHVLSFGKYNTTVKAQMPYSPPPPVDYGDFDNDGDLDIIVGDNTGSTHKVYLYFNDGTGNYTSIPRKEITSVNTAVSIISMSVGHFNNDSYLDFIMANESGGSSVKGWVYFNDGQQNFSTSSSVFQDLDVSCYTTGDVNNDGIDDYIYQQDIGIELLYDKGEPDGSSTRVGNYAGFASTIQSLSLTDLNASSVEKDLLIGFFNGTFATWRDFPNGSIHKNDTVSIDISVYSYPISGDFDNDGFNDTLVVNATTLEIVLTLNASLNPVQWVVGHASGGPFGLATGDFDKDGDLDFVIGIGGDQFEYFFNNNSYGPLNPPGFSSQIVASGGDVLAAGDFNNDSYIDISAYRSDYHILHFIQGFIPPPTISSVDVSYDQVKQTINIENISVYCSEHGVINNTNAIVNITSIMNSTFQDVNLTGNLTWTGSNWEALNIDVSMLPEGDYYINVTFGDTDTLGNNSLASQISTKFTVDHDDGIYGINVNYLGNEIQKINITIDIVNCSYSGIGNITGYEAKIRSFAIFNATGYYTGVNGNFTYSNTTGIFRWEAINISTTSLPEGTYYVSINFSDYLGYDNISINSSTFNVDHVLFSTGIPSVSYDGNLTQIIHIRNISVYNTYNKSRIFGKGSARAFNFSIYDNNTKAFTGVAGNLSYDGSNWYADFSVTALPEGEYYLSAFFMDILNDTITTANSNVFSIEHSIDLSNLQLEYMGEMIQQVEITVTPTSTYDGIGILNETEALNKTYLVFPYNESVPVETGQLTWNGVNWHKIIDVRQYPENNYIVQINFADDYANVTQNSSIFSVYHYINITKPSFEYNFTSQQLTISNITANCSFHGIINNTNVVPTVKLVTVISGDNNQNVTNNFTYSSPYWSISNFNISSIMLTNISIYFQFEVNESWGDATYTMAFNNGTGYLILLADNIEVQVTMINPTDTLEGLIIVDPVLPFNYPSMPFIGSIYRIEVSDDSVSFTATISIHYSQDELDSRGINENLLSIYTFVDGDWVEIVPIERDTVNNIITIRVSHFSYFVLMEGSPSPSNIIFPIQGEQIDLLLVIILIGVIAAVIAVGFYYRKRRQGDKPPDIKKVKPVSKPSAKPSPEPDTLPDTFYKNIKKD
ncbi:MAG: FG-GAP-like repeat-containing protein [Candidatus Helarchaeota archaeon]